MQLWLQAGSFDPARGSLTSYVTMMARSRALDRWRTRAARESAVERSADQARGHRVRRRERGRAGDPPRELEQAARRAR